MKEHVLFICTHNSARSQMAEAFLREMYGNRFEAKSAGIDPKGVHPLAVDAMREIGIDISGQRSKSLLEFRDESFDVVVTVCDHARESCPFFPGGKQQLHKGFEDPSSFSGSEEEVLVKFREVRDSLKKWIEELFIEKATRSDFSVKAKELWFNKQNTIINLMLFMFDYFFCLR